MHRLPFCQLIHVNLLARKAIVVLKKVTVLEFRRKECLMDRVSVIRLVSVIRFSAGAHSVLVMRLTDILCHSPISSSGPSVRFVCATAQDIVVRS